MIEYARHVSLRSHSWNEGDVSAAINDIVADGLEHFDGERFWPAHPLDEVFFGRTGFYYGATGMIWAFDYLRCVGATKRRFDFRPFLPRLMDARQTPDTLPALSRSSRDSDGIRGCAVRLP
jgi:hypothetical protein